MEQDVPDEVQAAMGLKLVGDVRELIRDEVRKALEDQTFMNHLASYALATAVQRHFNFGDYNFQQGVKQCIVQQMQKY